MERGSVKKIARIINKLITHPRDRAGDYGVRMLMHIPIGLIMSIPVLGWGIIPIFRAYERNEDLHTEDQAWKDHAGALHGQVIGALAQIAVLIFFWVRGWK
jgi:hypothetical protein